MYTAPPAPPPTGQSGSSTVTIRASAVGDNAQTSLTAARDAQIDALADQADARYDLERATGRIRNLIPTPMPAETPAAGAAATSTPSASQASPSKASDIEKSPVRRRDPK